MKILIADQIAGDPARRAVYRALAERAGMHPTLIVPSRWNDGFADTQGMETDEGSLRVVTGRTVFSGSSHRAFIPRIWTLLTRERFDVLYLESEPESYQSLHAIIGCRLFSPRTKIVVMSWRNIDFPPGVYPFRAAWTHSFAERTALRRVAGIVAHNMTARRLFQARQAPEVVHIPPGVDVTFFQSGDAVSAKRAIGLTKFAIGYVGRLVPEKGIDILLMASVRLTVDHEILLVGEGPEESRLRNLSNDLGISERIHWTGGVPCRLLPEYYRAMDIVVLPSRTTPLWKEQFGRVLTEAMSCNIPVVGSDSGEIRDTIGDGGMTFREGSVSDLAGQITRLHGDPWLRKRLGERGRDRAVENFSTQKVAGMYQEFLERVAG